MSRTRRGDVEGNGAAGRDAVAVRVSAFVVIMSLGQGQRRDEQRQQEQHRCPRGNRGHESFRVLLKRETAWNSGVARGGAAKALPAYLRVEVRTEATVFVPRSRGRPYFFFAARAAVSCTRNFTILPINEYGIGSSSGNWTEPFAPL